MKKILVAWIEQTVQFDSATEYMDFIEKLEKSKKKYFVMSKEEHEDGTVLICIRKQYNNNRFPESWCTK